MKEGESPNSISFIYQRTLLDQAILRPKIDLLSTRQNEETIEAINGACRTTNDAIFKIEKSLGCNDFEGQMIQSFFPQLAKKIQSQRNSYNSIS